VRPFQFANMQKIRESWFLNFFLGDPRSPNNGTGLRRPSPCSTSSAFRYFAPPAPFSPSVDLPYLEIKLTFECTAWFYGLTPPLCMCYKRRLVNKPIAQCHRVRWLLIPSCGRLPSRLPTSEIQCWTLSSDHLWSTTLWRHASRDPATLKTNIRPDPGNAR